MAGAGRYIDSHPASKRDAGFTLLELMVAFALVALLIMIMGGSIRFGARVWEASKIHADAIGEIQAIRGFLRERVLAARPVKRVSEDGSQNQFDFQGSRDGGVGLSAPLPVLLHGDAPPHEGRLGSAVVGRLHGSLQDLLGPDPLEMLAGVMPITRARCTF